MISIKGFASSIPFTNNTKDQVSPIGELSAESVTFAKDRGIYYKNDVDGIVLTTFTSRKDGKDITLSVDLRDHIFEVVDWVYKYSGTKNGEIFTNQLLQDILAQFQSIAENFKSGPIATTGTLWMPEWVSWSKTGSEETNIRIWFSDQSFRNGYDDFSITVIPPIKPLDDLFKIASSVEAKLNERTPAIRTEEIQNAKENKPETILRTEYFRFTDIHDRSLKLDTYWDYLIYGAAGNSVDNLKDATIKYILANSRKTREEWIKIFPDIFRRTEFVIVPLWNQYSIPNRITERGLHSPFVKSKEVTKILKKFSSGYEEAHIAEHAEVFHHPYKSLALLTIGSSENREDIFSLSRIVPDYIAQTSTSQDFNRQSIETREWSEKLSLALLLAEQMTVDSDVPKGMTRLLRDGKLFVVFNYDNIHYLVATKVSVSEE